MFACGHVLINVLIYNIVDNIIHNYDFVFFG
jgi:hypothetical protein